MKEAEFKRTVLSIPVDLFFSLPPHTTFNTLKPHAVQRILYFYVLYVKRLRYIIAGSIDMQVALIA